MTIHISSYAIKTLERRAHSRIAQWLAIAYGAGIARRLCLRVIRRLEGGDINSSTLRRVLKDYHSVTVGPYSYGPCLVPGVLPQGTVVGNYCSIADGLRVFRRNHPAAFLSLHPYFYNSKLGVLTQDAIAKVEDNPLEIGSDVWIGANVTILPGCRSIGDGAIVGAGAVVTADIPSFTIWAGNPARLVRERFDVAMKELVAKTKWWLISLPELHQVAGDLLYRPLATADVEKLCAMLERKDAKANHIN